MVCYPPGWKAMDFSLYLRQQVNPIWEAAHTHPFVQGIGKGTLPEEKFIFFLEQDYVYLIEYCRFFGLAVAKGETLADMQKYAEVLHALLHFEMDLHRSVCAEFGISAQELEQVKATPTNIGYTSYLLKVAYAGDAGDILAALLPCLWGYVEIGQRLKAQGLPAHKHYRRWIETYASPEFAEISDWCKARLNAFASSQKPEKLKRLEELFLTTSRWEYLFWEMAWGKKEWPL